MSGEAAAFFKELPVDQIPQVDVTLADGSVVSLASNSELPLEQMAGEQELYLCMFPYLQEHVFVKTSVGEFLEGERHIRAVKEFESQVWPRVQDNFASTIENLGAIFEGVKSGDDEAALQKWQEFMEDCAIIATGHKIIDHVDVMVLLESPESDTSVQKEYPVFRIKA